MEEQEIDIIEKSLPDIFFLICEMIGKGFFPIENVDNRILVFDQYNSNLKNISIIKYVDFRRFDIRCQMFSKNINIIITNDCDISAFKISFYIRENIISIYYIDSERKRKEYVFDDLNQFKRKIYLLNRKFKYFIDNIDLIYKYLGNKNGRSSVFKINDIYKFKYFINNIDRNINHKEMINLFRKYLTSNIYQIEICKNFIIRKTTTGENFIIQTPFKTVYYSESEDVDDFICFLYSMIKKIGIEKIKSKILSKRLIIE